MRFITIVKGFPFGLKKKNDLLKKPSIREVTYRERVI